MDAYPISSSSTVFSGSIFSIQREMEEHADKKLKQLKLMTSAQECAHFSVPENSSPLGLTLRKTPSFLDLVETKLSHFNSSCSEPRKRKTTEADAVTQQTNGKTKASNFTVSILRIGSWERNSRYDGDLVAKCYFAKRRFLWEVLDGRLKTKIEVSWSDIASIKATFKDNASEVLEIELLRRPLFFRETNPQPRKHTLWKSTEDFTGGQASIFRRHKLQFPQGTLQKHYERLLQLDSGLSLLSKKPYPSLDSPFFGPDDVESQNHGLFGLEGDNTDLLNQVLWGSSDDHSEQLQCFTLTRNVPQQYSNPDCIVASYITSSKNSGASRSYLGHGSLNSGSYVLPSVSVPPSSFITTDSSESYHCNENEAVEVIADPFGSNLGVAGLCQGKLNSVVTTNSTLEFKLNCWVSEIYQTDHNLAAALEGSIGRSDMDQYCTGFSQLGVVDENLHGEMFGDWLNSSQIFRAPHPSLIINLEEQEASSVIKESVDWTSSWM